MPAACRTIGTESAQMTAKTAASNAPSTQSLPKASASAKAKTTGTGTTSWKKLSSAKRMLLTSEVVRVVNEETPNARKSETESVSDLR